MKNKCNSCSNEANKHEVTTRLLCTSNNSLKKVNTCQVKAAITCLKVKPKTAQMKKRKHRILHLLTDTDTLGNRQFWND